jgi:hypothetical protein
VHALLGDPGAEAADDTGGVGIAGGGAPAAAAADAGTNGAGAEDEVVIGADEYAEYSRLLRRLGARCRLLGLLNDRRRANRRRAGPSSHFERLVVSALELQAKTLARDLVAEAARVSRMHALSAAGSAAGAQRASAVGIAASAAAGESPSAKRRRVARRRRRNNN